MKKICLRKNVISKNMKLLITVVFSLVLMMITSCNKKDNMIMQDAVEPQNTKTFDAVLYGKIANLDPIYAFTDSQTILFNQIFDTLFEISPHTLQVIPNLIKEYTYSKDLKTYTFHLKRNAFFHDGSRVKAKDVIFSLKRNIFKHKGKVHHELFIISGVKDFIDGKTSEIGGLKASDDYTIQISLNAPYPLLLYVLSSLSTSILPEKYKEQINSGKFFEKPIGTGAFSIQEMDLNKKVVLKANKKYHGGPPEFDHLIFWGLSEQEAKKRFQKNELDQIFPYNLKTSEIEATNTITVPYRVYYTISMFFNFRKFDNNPFDKLINRQIIKSLSNVQSMQKKINNPMLQPAVGFVPYGMSGYVDIKDKPIKIPKSTLEALKKYEIRIGISNGVDEHEAIVSHLNEMYQKNGLNVEIVTDHVNEIVKGILNNTYHAIIVLPFYTYPDSYSILERFKENNYGNGTGYSNKKVNRLLDSSMFIHEKEERSKLYQKINKAVCDDVAMINFFHGGYRQSIFAQGWRIPPLNYIGEIFLKYRYIQMEFAAAN